MKQIKNISVNTVYIVSLFGLMSCIKEIDLGSLRSDPTLVVNYVAITGEPLTVSASRTWFFTGDHPNVTLDKAGVSLLVNDVSEKHMSFQEGDEAFNTKGYFESSFIPVKGNHIRVEASYLEHGVASAETVMPEPAQILKAGVTYATVTDSFGSARQDAIYQVTPEGNPTEENCYLLRMEESIPVFDRIAKEYTGEYKWFSVGPDYATGPVFGQSLTALDQIFSNDWMYGYDGRVFSDELISGQEYTLHLTDEYYYEPYYGSYPLKVVPDSMRVEDLNEEDFLPIPSKHLRVRLYAISAECYRYLKALQGKDTGSVSSLLIDGGLAELIRVFSNIDGGVSTLGSCHVGTFETEVASPSYSNLETARFKDGTG